MPFDASSPWPRRLLHIPTLESFEWQPGNVYNGRQNPKYNALSYTWGRWQLNEDEMPGVNAIPVKGTFWSIPRIDPSHFTAERFAAVLADTVDPYPSERDSCLIEFLWLDIACIDQTPGSREKAQEIGRQAKIFRGATRVFMWLTTRTRSLCYSYVSEIYTPFMAMCSRGFYTNVNIRDWAREVTMILADLLADPWFSSLWTLQETFLCPHALIMPGDAMKGEIGPCFIIEICETLEWIKDSLDHNDEIRAADKECGLGAMIDRTGLLVCLEEDSMGLLAAARFRTTRNEEDRVYGIMQVFEFQLGASAPDVDPNRVFGLKELLDQLGAALLDKKPILSQAIALRGHNLVKGWKLNRCSTIPAESRAFYHGKTPEAAVESHATFTRQQEDRILSGRCSRPMIPFRDLVKRLSHDWPNTWHHGGATVLLDWHFLNECPELDRATSLSRAAFLASYTPEVTMLPLGIQIRAGGNGDNSRGTAVGLLLHRYLNSESSNFLKRVGVFLRSIDSARREDEAVRDNNKAFNLLAQSIESPTTTTKSISYLKGEDSIWKGTSGSELYHRYHKV